MSVDDSRSLNLMRIEFGRTYSTTTTRVFINSNVLLAAGRDVLVERLAQMLDAKADKTVVDAVVAEFFTGIDFKFKRRDERNKRNRRRSEVKAFVLELARARQLGFVVSPSEFEGFGLFLLDSHAHKYPTAKHLLRELNTFTKLLTPKSSDEQARMRELEFSSTVTLGGVVEMLNGLLSYINHNMHSRLVFSNGARNLLKALDRGPCKCLFLVRCALANLAFASEQTFLKRQSTTIDARCWCATTRTAHRRGDRV